MNAMGKHIEAGDNITNQFEDKQCHSARRLLTHDDPDELLATLELTDDLVAHRRELRDRDEQTTRTPHVRIGRQVILPKVVVKVFGVAQTAHEARVEVRHAFGPVAVAPGVRVHATRQRNRRKAARR